jgi:hypothetical protein
MVAHRIPLWEPTADHFSKSLSSYFERGSNETNSGSYLIRCVHTRVGESGEAFESRLLCKKIGERAGGLKKTCYYDCGA